MLLKIIFFITFAISAVLTEPPINKSGPYSAAGWRPSKPFNFPREYISPAEIAKQYQGQYPTQSQVDFEITKARVDFVGQVQDNVFIPNTRKPHKEYLSPNRPNPNPNFLNVQDLPLQTILQQYNPSSQPQPVQEQQQQQFFPKPQRPQYKPNNERDSPELHVPADKYGPPQSFDFNIIYPDPEPRNFEEDKRTMRTSSGGGDIADYVPDANERPNEYVRAKQGQYFVLGPDNTIQRVAFTTTQDEEEKRTNGFTAQLKYTPVGELRDPVFKYNNRGQLVRVLKKK